MKSRVFAVFVAVLCVIIGGMPLLAQQRAPQVFDFREFPAIPPVPPIPPIPPIPFFVAPEAYEFAYGGGQTSAAAVDPAVQFQQEVFRTLLRTNPDRALDLAAERLKSDAADPVVLGNLSSIAASTSAKALPLLISIAKKSTNTRARNEATLALARNRNDKDGLATLEDLYASSSDSIELRRTIVSSMSRMSDPRAVSVLARIAKNDPDDSIRRNAVQSLGMRKEPEAMKALEDLLTTTKTRG